jgi:4-amino-4-deoxy-L-arabinose transferase-like glycosyltransferase
MAVIILAAILAAAVLASEVVLGGRKLQAALPRVLPVFVVAGLTSLAYLVSVHGIHPFTLIIFWTGAFLSWFGVRSHIESSILLRMASLLAEEPMSSSQLLARYEEVYGEQARRNELARAGLILTGSDGITLTPKGRAIHRVARALSWSRGLDRTTSFGRPPVSAETSARPESRRPAFLTAERMALLAILLVSLTLNTIGMTWGLPAYESWSNDDLTPLSPLVAARGRFATPTKYPPVHHAILALVDGPYIGYLYLTGQFTKPSAEFPYGFADPLTALTTLIVLGRIVSALMGVGVVYLVYRATRVLTGHAGAALLAACVMALNPEFVLFAHLGNADLPALFWLAVAMTCYVKVAKEWRASDGALLGAAGALAIATKDTSYAALAGMALVLVASWAYDRRPVQPLAAGLGAFLIAYPLLSNWVWGWRAYVVRLKSFAVQTAQEQIQVPATLSGQAALLRQTFVQLVECMGWPMFLALAIGLVLVWRHYPRRLGLALLVPVVTHYVGAIAAVRFVFPRYLLPVIMLLAPVTGLALAGCLSADRWKRFRTPAVVAVLAFSVVWAARVDAWLLSDIRYQAEAYLRQRVPRDRVVEVYAPFTYLPRLRELGFTVRQVRPRTGAADEVFSGRALAARNPDVIVLTSKGSAGTTSTYRQYFDDLRAGRLGYRATIFRGLDTPDGSDTTDSDEYVSRVSPTIWILERTGPGS